MFGSVEVIIPYASLWDHEETQEDVRKKKLGFLGKSGVVPFFLFENINIFENFVICRFNRRIFTFNFKDKETASLKNFYQEKEVFDDILNCEFEGVLGTTASIVGTFQANEALKMIMEIGQSLKNQILIIDLLNLNFRKVKFKKR